MSRRQFMESTMGMALTLTAINELGCRSSQGTSASGDAGCGFAPTSGPYIVAPEATCDPSAQIACTDFIFDIQTYCFDAGEWRTRNIVYPTFLDILGNCTDEADPLDCFDPKHYAEGMFVGSDTTMTVISGWPASGCFPERQLLHQPALACGLPLSNAGTRALRDWINQSAKSQRCINHSIVMPNDFLEHQLEAMYGVVSDPSWRCAGWTTFPAWQSDTYRSPQGYAQGFFMTDPIGVAFVEAGLRLGVPNFGVHKGLPLSGFDEAHNEPTDIGPIASMFPHANFIVYSSAYGAGMSTGAGNQLAPYTEGPYEANDAMPTGVNMLIRSLLSSKVVQDPDITKVPVAPHNVYAEMGGAWSVVMQDVAGAQHYVGKLLKYLGPANVCWGTKGIVSTGVQAMIEAFRAFTITPQYQAMYGYPALTPAIKAQIFGLNAARIYGVDPCAPRCAVTGTSFG
jgi:hypothetical protein